MDLRKIDALVAEYVMEWKHYPNNRNGFNWQAADEGYYELPEYSTDIKAAWEVVEKMKSFETGFALITLNDQFKELKWIAKFTLLKPKPHMKFEMNKSAPLAICLAALKAKGVEV